MRLLVFLTLIVGSGLCAAAQSDVQLTTSQQKQMAHLLETPLFEPALDYSEIQMIEGCEERGFRPQKYQMCRSSTAIYEKAYENAKAANQPLMVVFGFDSCPPCVALQKTVFSSKSPVLNNHIVRYLSRDAINTYVAEARPLKISVVYIHNRVDHGFELADQIGATQMAKDQGWFRVWAPFILFVNPQTGKKHSESKWHATEVYCDWGAEFAAALEGIEIVPPGETFTERKLCKS